MKSWFHTPRKKLIYLLTPHYIDILISHGSVLNYTTYWSLISFQRSNTKCVGLQIPLTELAYDDIYSKQRNLKNCFFDIWSAFKFDVTNLAEQAFKCNTVTSMSLPLSLHLIFFSIKMLIIFFKNVFVSLKKLVKCWFWLGKIEPQGWVD